jgi:integrase
MLHGLGPQGERAWHLLDAVVARTLPLGELYDAWRVNDLLGLRARRNDVDLTASIPSWQAWLMDRVKPSTAEHYLTHLRTLMPEDRPFLRSQLTAPAVAQRGTKAWTRDGIARVADWAWPYVEAHWRRALPGERLFRGLHRWGTSDAHREQLRVLNLPHHRLHDARHHWAVRMVRAGMFLELIARQLGHRDVAMVAKVYGRFVPNSHERERWEAAAAALDVERWGDRGVSRGASTQGGRARRASRSLATTTACEACDDSRGGTRPTTPAL